MNLKFINLRLDYTYLSICDVCELEVCSEYTVTCIKSTPKDADDIEVMEYAGSI